MSEHSAQSRPALTRRNNVEFINTYTNQLLTILKLITARISAKTTL